MVADGGTRISDLAVLRNQPELFDGVASTPTAWRTLEAIDGDVLDQIAVAALMLARTRGPAGWIPGSTSSTSTPR